MLKKIFIIGFLFLLNIYASSVGKISMIKGEAIVHRDNNQLNAKILMAIENKDKIQTKKRTKIQLTFNDETVVTLGSKTEFEVEEYLLEEKNSKIEMSVKSGSFKVISGRIGKLAPKNFLLKTKTSLIGIRGTIFAGNVNEQGNYIACIKGSITVSSTQTNNSVVVNKGYMVFVDKVGVIGEVKKMEENSFVLLNHLQGQNSIKMAYNKEEKNTQEEDNKVIFTKSYVEEEKNKNKEEKNYDKVAENIKAIEDSKSDIQTLIDNKSVIDYSGKLNGVVKGENKIDSTLTKLEGNISADMDMRVDFGGNSPLKVELSNQNTQITSATVNGVPTNDLPVSNLNSNLNLNMNQKIDKDNLKIEGTYEKSNNGFVTKANLDGKFKNKEANGITGTFNESTKGSLNGLSIDRAINANFDVDAK